MTQKRRRSPKAAGSDGSAPLPRPKRSRAPWRILAAVATVLAAIAAWRLLAPRGFSVAPSRDRNVLLLTIDTLRADALSSYGGRARTPGLDELAATGARFTFAHAHAVVTLPSHSTIMSGRYPYEHGVRDNNGFRFKPDEPTIATRLRKHGFATGAFVGAFPLDRRFGLGTGFDIYDDGIPEMGGPIDFALPERRADAVVTPALKWIGEQRGPWFTWVHVFDPHAPYRAPDEIARQYPGHPYAGEVAWTDRALGPLFERLWALDRPTLVIVTADHGESLGEHGEQTHGIFAYEATLRVPLIVAEITPGSRGTRRDLVIDTPVRHVDILPTILDAVGLEGVEGLPGSSLLPLIGRGSGDDRPSYFEAMTANLSRGWAPLAGVLAARSKYVHLPEPELYELDRDAGERTNEAARQRSRSEQMLDLLQTYSLASPNRPGEETSAVRDRLRALGYVGGSPAAAKDRYTLEDDPKRLIEIDALLHRGGEQYQARRLDDAAATFRQVIARRPDTADAYRYLAFVQWQAGRPRQAIATLEEALTKGISHRDVRVKLGVYLAQTGNANRAIGLLRGLTEGDVEALNSLGIAYGHAGRADEAMATFKEVLEIDPSNAIAHQNIGTIQLRAGDAAAAENSLRQALTIDPALHGAYTSLGVILSNSGRKSEAVTMWQRAIALQAGDFDALYNLVVTLAEIGRPREAAEYGRRYIDTAPPELYGREISEIHALVGRR